MRCLLRRGQPGEDAGRAPRRRPVPRRVIVSICEPSRDARPACPLPCRSGGDDFVVAGQDLDRDPVQAAERCHGRRGGVLGRVEEGEETQQDQVRLVLHRVYGSSASPRHFLIGHGDDPQPVLVQVMCQLAGVWRRARARPRMTSPLTSTRVHRREHFFHRALADQRVRRRHLPPPPTCAGARSRRGFRRSCGNCSSAFSVLVQLLVVEDRHVEQVLQAGMVDSCSGSHIAAPSRWCSPCDVQVLFEHDLVLGQGAGLVGAQHVHRPEVLDGVQALDDHLLARHGRAPLARLTVTIMGSISGVSPTATAMANRNASSQLCLLSPLMRNTSRNHHGDEADHQPGELVDALVEAGQLALPDDAGGQRAKVGPVPGMDDHGRRGAALDVGAQEADVGKFQRILNVGSVPGRLSSPPAGLRR